MVVGTTDSTSRVVGRLCTSCAQLALNGGPVSIPGGQSVTQVLTTANALDVWGQGRTSAAVLAQLTDSTVTQATRQGFKQFRGQVNGDLFELPAGTVKVAAGAEYLDYTISQDVTRPNGLGPATTNSRFLHLDYDRNVKALFGELFIPLVAPEMGIPGIRSLDLNLATRLLALHFKISRSRYPYPRATNNFCRWLAQPHIYCKPIRWNKLCSVRV